MQEGHFSRRNFLTPAFDKIFSFFGILSASADPDGTFCRKANKPTGLEPGRVTRGPHTLQSDRDCKRVIVLRHTYGCLYNMDKTTEWKSDLSNSPRISNTSLPARVHDSDSYHTGEQDSDSPSLSLHASFMIAPHRMCS